MKGVPPPTSEVGSEEQMLEEESSRSIDQNTTANQSVTISDMEAFFSRLMTNSSGSTNVMLPNLVRFDPDDAEADIEGWCNINEIIVKNKRLDGIDLLLALTHALRGRAASILMKLKSDQITWNHVKELLSKFSKPMMMQDYFDRILKFQINQKKTAADAVVRLWGLIEAMPKLHMSEEVIVGFVISILSQSDQTPHST